VDIGNLLGALEEALIVILIFWGLGEQWGIFLAPIKVEETIGDDEEL
jgi:hypothetical protein